METKKLKLLCTGRKGILLPCYPTGLSELYSLISGYFHETPDHFTVSFKDTDGDECEITDQETYEAAVEEFPTKIILKLTRKDLKVQPSVDSSPDPSKILVFFKKRTRDMAIYNIKTENIEWHKLSRGIVLKEYAAWVELPSGDVFYCGGGHPLSSDEVYLINPKTFTYRKLPNMLYARHSHGIVYNNGYVYIFGGIENLVFYGNLINKNERFNLADSYWEEIEDLETPRGDVAAAISENNIFVLGKGSNFIINYYSNQIVIDLEEDNGGSMVACNDRLYVFQGSFIKVYDLASLKSIDKIQLPGDKSWWSHSPPIFVNDLIYFVWWEDPGWICRYDHTKKEFKKLINFT